MVEITTVYEGNLRCRSTHGPSGAELITDAPKDNQGEGSSFSPTDLVGTALGACMLTIMGMVAKRENLDLAGTTIKVKKEMAATSPRRISRLEVEFTVPVATTEVQRQKLINAAETCPVHKSLHPDLEIAVKFNWSELVAA